jgi:diguanylate cyclase (GGDEF)-like protein/PAS domain S-box-containing protein
MPQVSPEVRALLEGSPDAVLVVDREGRITAINRRAAELFATAAERLLGQPVEVLLPDRLRERHTAARSAYTRAPTIRAMSARRGLMGRRADGREFPVEVSLAPILGSEGLVMAVVRETPAPEPPAGAGALDLIPDATLTIDASGNLTFLNRAAEELTGWSCDSARGRPIGEVLPFEGEPGGHAAESPVAECLRSGVSSGGWEARLAQPGAEDRLLDVSVSPMRDRSGRVSGALVIARDVTQARHLARQLSHQATHDPLTGLVNRGEFERRLVRVVASAAEEHTEHALGFLDLDGFKRVNDACGHLAGDELLRQVSGLMRERMRSGDTLGRLGGDEFGMLLEHCRLREAGHIADAIRRGVGSHRFVCGGRTHTVGASIGVVPIRSTAAHPAALLAAADAACYRAKRSGGDRVEVSEELAPAAASGPVQDRLRQVLAAVERDAFLLYAQPILSLHGSGGPASSLELLLRLPGEDGEPVPPGAFLPAARRHGLMRAIDQWVVRHAVRHLEDWRRANPGAPMPVVAINLDDETVLAGGMALVVGDVLGRGGLPPRVLCLEIAESAAGAHPTASAHLTRELHELGCRVTLEHGGSGMAAFTLLRRLQVDYLKIAGHIVRGLDRDPVSRALAGALNQVGHALGLETIAIEVESAELVDRLRGLGVDYAQGYALGRPEPLETALGRVGEGRWREGR